MTSDLKILTFDLEEWFHILDHDATRDEEQWRSFPSRIDQNTRRILDLLEERGQRATFFCLGWIARRHPDVIKKIAAAGHEVACHSDMHRLVYEQSPDQFRSDAARAIGTLEDLTGRKIVSFRAPGFSVTEQTTWVFEILADLGIRRDSSVFPARRAHGGFPAFGSAVPAIIRAGGTEIREFPVNTLALFGRPVVFSGGGYFRLLPWPLLDFMMKKSVYVMTYFHPRDFDPGQPVIPGLSLARRFKSYVGLSSAFSKLGRMLREHHFVSLEEADGLTDWNAAKKIIYG